MEIKFDRIIKNIKQKTAWINTKKYIILHHTAWWTFKWLLDIMEAWKWYSWHYTIWENGEIWKQGEDTDILWHAWDNTDVKLNGISFYNPVSIWIEVVSDKYGKWYNDKQRESLIKLVKYLQEKYKISYKNILRHKDITKRKIDLDDSFWNNKYKTYSEFIEKNFNDNYIGKMENTTEIKEKVSNYNHIQRYNIFNTNENDYKTKLSELSVWDLKDLIEIWLYRYDENKKANILTLRK